MELSERLAKALGLGGCPFGDPECLGHTAQGQSLNQLPHWDVVPVLLAFIESKGWRVRIEQGAKKWHCFIFGEQWAIARWAAQYSGEGTNLPSALADAVCAAVEGEQ